MSNLELDRYKKSYVNLFLVCTMDSKKLGNAYVSINTFLTNFTALKQPYLIFEIFNTFEYQKLDWHLQAEIVETNLVGYRISDKETTSFLFVSSRDDSKQCLFMVVSARNDSIQHLFPGNKPIIESFKGGGCVGCV